MDGEDAPSRWIGSFIVVGIVPLIMTVIWGFLHLVAPGTKYPAAFDRWEAKEFFPTGWNFFGGTPLLWLYIALVFLILAFVWGAARGFPAIATLLSLAMIGSLLMMLPGLISSDKVVGQFYQRNTTFYVANPDDPPAALRRLVQGGRKDRDGCAIKPIHDVPGCVKQGALPNTPGLWQGRSSSYNGALKVLGSSTANQQGADLLEPTLTYLGGETPETERWSGVIDGSGPFTPAQGVVEWYGKTGTVKKCQFNNKHSGTLGHKFNRGFEGAKKNSLTHLILSKYPGLTYVDSDAWGYCEGNKPVYVLPMTKYVPFHHRMLNVPAGVIRLKGSATGDPVIEYLADVKPGDIGGPVVPSSIVAEQRSTLNWAAGRKWNGNGFGFSVAAAETQVGNDSEYRLYNTIEKRWYYVTPLTPNNAKSQTYTAFALTPTDEVHAGELPPMRVYVLDDDPSVQANADRLHSDALSYLVDNKPGFTNNKGVLTEITPLGGDMWRIYGEVKGYTTDYIDMSANGRIAPTLTVLKNVPGSTPQQPLSGSQAPSGQPGATGTKVCQKPQAQMSSADLTACIKSLVDELAKRQTAPR